MISCCCFCSGKFQFPRTERLSSPPLLSALPSESTSLLPCILLLLLLCNLYSFCFIQLPLQIFPLITEVENISGHPRTFPATFLPKYLIDCISHCCIVGGNHGIDAHVLICQSNEWCEFPTYRCLKSASNIWVVPQLIKISCLLQTNSRGHRHQGIVTSCVCSILWMLTPDRKSFFTEL